jgi:hypothetical protein
MGTFTYHLGYDLGKEAEVLATFQVTDKTELSALLRRKANLPLAKSCRWRSCSCTIVELSSTSSTCHDSLPSAADFAEEGGLMGHSIEAQDLSGNWVTNWIEEAKTIHAQKLAPWLPEDKKAFDPDDVNVWASFEATIH